MTRPPLWDHRPPLWDHQRRAIEFVLGASAHDAQGESGGAHRRGTLLDMWMGLGKTRIAIEVVERLSARRALVLCPKAVMQTWVDHLDRLGSSMRACAPRKGGSRRKWEAIERALAEGTEDRAAIAVIVNYETAIRVPELLRVAWDVVVYDESHRLKTPSSKTSVWCWELYRRTVQANPAAIFLALTGTPMPHSPVDIYAQARAFAPRVLARSATEFRGRYCVTVPRIFNGRRVNKVVGHKNLDELRERMSAFTFSASKAVLDLPPVTHNEIRFDLSPKERRAYSAVEHELIAQIDEGEVNVANALVKLLRLQQITSGFVAVDDGGNSDNNGQPRHSTLIDTGTSKRDALREILEGISDGTPVVVFCRFVRDLDAVHEVSRELGRGSLELSGRQDQLDHWQLARTGVDPVLAVQIQAGGVGIDLTRAAYCVFYSTGFSLGDYDQACARVHRPGQTRPTHYYHLIARGTVDGKVRDALVHKRRVVDSVLDDLRKQGANPCKSN